MPIISLTPEKDDITDSQHSHHGVLARHGSQYDTIPTGYDGTVVPITFQSALERKLSSFIALNDTKLAILTKLQKQYRSFKVGQDLIHQGQTSGSIYILNTGWVCSYKDLSNGERQIIDFQIPGDFLGLRSVLLHASDHSIEPITDIEVSECSVAGLMDVFAQNHRLAIAILWAASRDEAMVVEHLIDLGRRNAVERLAHFLLELGSRLTLVGQGDTTGYACPLTQYHLADALGLSAVHVNRALRQLREKGLVTFQNGRVQYDNYQRLTEFADFDPDYLDQEGPLLP